LRIDDLGYADDGFFHLTLRYGFSEDPDVPRGLRDARAADQLLLDIDPAGASYFLSRATLRITPAPGLSRWRKLLFVALSRNAANPAAVFGLPVGRTVVMGTQIGV
jgi:KUP system potassium uptake protein